MMDYPNWFMEEVKELEQDLADGWISFTEFNNAMDDLERQLEHAEEQHDTFY